MNYCTIKFKFDLINDYSIKDIFNNAKNLLNYQFDDDSNVFFIDTDVNYQIEDVSDLKPEEIEKITNSFFNFKFENTSNIFLYKFLVLKNIDKSTILAIIHPLIFSYSSINDFYEIINNINSAPIENYLSFYYKDVKNYLDSSDYDNDLNYWKNIKLNASDYVKFHNLKSNKYKRCKIEIDKESVLYFIKNQDCSIFNFYASAFSLYISRINRQKGCLLKTSTPSKISDLKTILKMDLTSTLPFADYLHQLNSIYEEAVRHTKVSIENYMDEDLSYYSIYDFSNLNENICIYNGEDSALTLNIYDNYLEIVYNADLFSDIYIQHMADNIKSMINNLVKFPDNLLNNMNILSDNEEKLLSNFCKGEYAEVNEDITISESFRQHALENPNAIAIDDGVNQVSYGELEKSSNSIANDLFENYNISQGSHVALMLPRTYHFPELVLALNKLGATFIPIDLIYPVKRIKHMLDISEAECIVTTKDIASKLNLNVDIICIEDLNSSDDVDIDIKATAEDLFSIMFTSGTTGLPKGVMITNRQISGLIIAFKNIFYFSYGDLIGCYLSFSFIASYVIYPAFAFGGGCRIFNENEQKDIFSLIKILKEKPMNSLFLPPTIAIPVLESDDIKLDYLVLAGAKLKELSKKERNTQLINFYGTTEIIFGVTKVYDFKDIYDENLSIGRPITNTNVYILDEDSNQMPIGVPGEICVSSKYISPGYYNNPELTQEVFVDNPYSDSENNKIMYRTGDIGFYNFDGDIEIIGREDDQLSVRGFRIESGEILNIINNIPQIENVYLDAENDTLALYYTTNDEIDIDIIKGKLMDDLPSYMIPSLFMELEEIPLNMNGKIDKIRLKKMSKVNTEIDIEDEVLAGVVDAFKEVLDTDLVLVNDNFVELGGNSLSAMNLQILLREKFYVNISSQEIIELSTPNNISDYIKSHLKDSADTKIKYTFDERCSLSESQLNVYLDEITQDMGTKYNNPFIIEFKEKYSADQIRNALNKLFDVHPILKGRIINKKDEMPSCIFDAKPEIQEGSLNDIQSFVRPFDFEKCLSKFLIIVEEDSTSLCIDIHHVIFDGSSTNILLNSLYSILEDKNVDFVDDGILREISFEENLSPDYMDEAKTFMFNMLADRDEVHELIHSTDSATESKYINTFDIDGNELTGFLQDHSITRNQFFSSVFAYTLSRFTGSSKVLFNILEDGRGHINHSQSVGMFVKTLPIIMDCKNQTVDSFLEYSSSLVNTVMKYDLYPFRLLANEFDLKFDVSFQYAHNLFSALLDKDEYGYSVNELEHDPEGDLTFFIFDVNEGKLGIRILYSDKFSNTFIETFTKTYMLILHEMLNVYKLEEINYIENDDLNLLDSFNQTEHDLKYDCVMDALNRQLSENPDNILTLSEDANYTYSQIAHIVNGLNSLLKQHEVVSNDIVTVFVDRNHWILITALCCLSQGITYVPIDENHPDKRIEFMIRQSKSKAIIVTDTFQKRVEKINDESNLNLNIINVSYLLDEVKISNHVDYVDSGVNDVACILYTSGTTGNPKAVQMTTLGILNLIEYYVESTGFKSDDVLGIFASVGFDVSLEQFASVFTGGSLTYVPNDIRLNISKLNDYFINYGVTHTLITTQIAKLFVDTVSETSLKYLQTAGEKLGSIIPPKNYTFNDVYGPTEANYITSIDVDKKLDDSSVGMLNWNNKAYILDNELRRVPLGAVGEIYLSGYQTTKGYFKNPNENKKALFQNPFDGKINGYNRMYKTGDLGRYLPDGSIAIIGRVDSQVKIRGNRVELSEIEQTIRCIEYIDDVTVQTIKIGSNNELVAYVVVPDFEGDIVEYIKDYMGQCKPEYMVPSFVVPIDKIPLNVNGKVNKRLLPTINVDTLRNEYVAPRNKLEKDIVEAFEEVFNQEKIGIYDDFTELGGDSLTAVKLLAILEDYNLSAGDILSLNTPQAIADNINENNVEFDLDVYSIDSGCPLNESQLNIYLDIVVNEKTDAYLLPTYMEFSNDYDLNEITYALNKMFEVHPILNMRISDEYDVPYLIRNSKPQIIVESDVDDDFIIEFLTRSFDLHDSLCRFLVIENDDSYDLYCAFHHIICDARSCAIFKENLMAILNGQTLEVDDSFLKVSAFSQHNQESELFIKAREFYDNMLVDCDESGVLLDSIGADRHGSAQIDLDLDCNIFLNQPHINENVLFTSVFAYTLSRFTGNDKALFNIIDNGRSRFNNYDAIGMYVNTLPILVDCSNRDISSFIEYMSSLVYEVQSYNYYPFRLLANEHDIDANILFQFIPEWIDNDDNNVREVYEKLGILGDMDDLNADLTFEVLKKGGEYYLNAIYCDKYSGDFINHFIQSYKLILHGILNANKLNEINYASNEDIRLLNDYNNTEHDLIYCDILDAFNDHLAKCPDSTLVSMDNREYTYGEGAYLGDKIAKQLMSLGVDSQDCVPFLTERSEYYMFSVLGILSMGGVYVPLDDTLPDERIKFMLNDTNACVVIVSDSTYKRAIALIDDLNNENVVLLNISDILKENIDSISSLPVVYGDIAGILYTSGSTGVPKGVKVTRMAILNVAEYYADTYGLCSNDVYALYPSIGFDAGCESLFKAIYTGACLSIVPEDIRYNMRELNNYFIKQNVTHTIITTQVGKLFMERIEDTSLDYLFVGGEKLGEFPSPANYQLVDEYGPTEANNFVSSINNSKKIDSSSIGRLNYNTKAYVLDDNQRRVPLGAVGELYLAGYQIAEGYLNRDDETKESFLKNPFDDGEEYSVIYRTGDMVRFLPDGSLAIIGRQDGQVKIRGNRVELSEVESTIRNIDFVEDITVQTIKNRNNNELVAYVVISADMEDNILRDVIYDYVNEHKPEFMVPSFVIKLDEIPLNVNGKVDKRALPKVDFDSLSAEYVAPTNKTERDVVEAFQKVFGQENIGIYDDFIRLGGDSLTAIRLLSYLEEYNITVADILSLHTPYAIAKNINKSDMKFDLDIYSLDSGCPLNESQLNVYLDIIANDKKDSYLIPLHMNISDKYNINDIKDALDIMLDVHPILGMCISDDFNVPYLIKESKPSVIVESDIDDDFINNFLVKPFDLYDSLCRFLIVKNDDGFSLFAAFHHIIFDALSNTIFKQDLQSILEGNAVDLDDSFLEVSAFSQQIVETSAFVKADEFYESMLVDVEEACELLDSVLSDGPGSVLIDLDLDQDIVNSFLDKHNVSVNLLFSGAFAYTLSKFVGSEKVLFNIVENGRDRFANYNSIGMFVNTLPLLVDCENQDIDSFMNHMFDRVYGVMRYNYYPFRLLANKYDINSNIIFQFIPEWIKDNSNFEDVYDNDLLSDMDDVIADLTAIIIQRDNEYILSILYSDKYSRDFINHFVESYKLILQCMLNSDDLSDISYISNEDLVLLDEINNTSHDLYYHDVLDAFNDNLSKYPNNKLVLGDNVSYTYAESAFLIDKIQKLLNENNIGVNDTVSVFVERNHWILLSNLAVLSVGASYVPIDENHPINRIKYMVEKSGAKAIITTNHFQNHVDELIKELDSKPTVINVSSLSENVGELNSLTYHNPTHNDVACILFTSGTTGNPKAVQVGRHSIANMVSYYQHNSNFTSDNVYGVFASVGFDVSLQHYVALLTGGSVIWIPNDIKLNIRKLNEYFIKHGVTHTIITTQVSKLFTQSIDNTSLQNLCAVGEKLGAVTPPENYEFIDVYGPTEATSSMTSINVRDKIDASSVGGPDWNTKIYVLDSQQRRVPFGAVGELYISGYQVSKGYLNNPEANRKAFFNNPFDGEIQGYETMYKTGDIVHLLPDGTIGFIGRNDSQVKIRGNRVELSEIESAIREIDYVSDITVQTIKHDENNEIVAYVVVNNDLDEMELKNSICDYVSKHKPEYMVPSFVIKLDAIPLNVNGKVDKRALPEVDRDSLSAEYVAPRDENEKEIVEAFEKAFDLDRISIYDDFIRLGGDSLIAIKLLNYIESDDITMADIFTFRTPEAIAKNMSEFSFDLDIYSLEEGCPLNSAQINVFGDVIGYNKVNAYHIPVYIPISKKYGLEKILDSLDVMLDMHPILSMHLIERYEENDNNIPKMDVLKDLIKTAQKFGMKKIMNIVKNYGIMNVKGLYKMLKTLIKIFGGDYPYLVKGEKPPILVKSKLDKDILIDFFAESFDLYNYLSKFMIVESEESYYLFYMVHHIIFDAISAGIFKRELLILLEGGSIDFDDAFLKSSAFTHQIKNTEKFDEAGEFYHSFLSDLDDVGNLLEDNPSAEGYDMSSYDLEFDKDAFKSFLRNAEISENVLFTGIFSHALSQFVNGNKVIFTIVENGRDRFNENFIGMTSNVMPMVIDCKDQSISSFMRNVSDIVYGVLRHNYYPILLLYQKYDFEVNILFQYVPNWVADDFTGDNIKIENINSKEINKYILNNFSDYLTEFFVQVYQIGDDYKLFITHSNKFSDKLVEDFKNMYITILSNIINSDLSSNLSDTLK